MLTAYFIKGIIIGLSVAAPVGPINILCINRTLTHGRSSGFVSGIGAALADTIYGIIAGFGVTAVSAFLITHEFWMKTAGGALLILLGVKLFFGKPVMKEIKSAAGGHFQNFISTFFLTLTNPVTIFSFAAIFATFGLITHKSGYVLPAMLVTGVFLGSALWWLLLSSVVGFLKSKITTERLIWINRIAGILVIAFGLWAMYSGMEKYV